jgi:hypothetical protein
LGYLKILPVQIPEDHISDFENIIKAAIAAADTDMLQQPWMELECCLDIVCVIKGAHVECM